MVRAFWPVNASPGKCLQCQKWSLYKSRGAFLHPFMLKRREMAQLLPTKAFLQPAKTAAMCMASPDYAHPPPPILLMQNLSWKWIAPTDNMVSWWVHPSSVVKGVVECLAIHVVPFPSTFFFLYPSLKTMYIKWRQPLCSLTEPIQKFARCV